MSWLFSLEVLFSVALPSIQIVYLLIFLFGTQWAVCSLAPRVTLTSYKPPAIGLLLALYIWVSRGTRDGITKNLSQKSEIALVSSRNASRCFCVTKDEYVNCCFCLQLACFGNRWFIRNFSSTKIKVLFFLKFLTRTKIFVRKSRGSISNLLGIS